MSIRSVKIYSGERLVSTINENIIEKINQNIIEQIESGRQIIINSEQLDRELNRQITQLLYRNIYRNPEYIQERMPENTQQIINPQNMRINLGVTFSEGIRFIINHIQYGQYGEYEEYEGSTDSDSVQEQIQEYKKVYKYKKCTICLQKVNKYQCVAFDCDCKYYYHKKCAKKWGRCTLCNGSHKNIQIINETD